jgi:Amidohydrolase
MADYNQLRAVITGTAVIDNHAHNLLLPGEYSKQPFHLITTEAQGSALHDTFTSLSHLRAVRQLRELYEFDGSEEQWNWDQLLKSRAQWLSTRPEELIRKCLAGTHAILMDDGLGNPDAIQVYDYHDAFTQAHTQRIVRIESLAEGIMAGVLRGAKDDVFDYEDFMPNAWKLFTENFETQINTAIDDPEVVGFKSVICYRSGLDIDPDYEQALLKVGKSFEHYIQRVIDGNHRARDYRFDRKPLNIYIVLKTCELLSEHPAKTKPLQFHTGLGDADIELRRSNPAYLQALVEEYPSVRFVILHAAYPFTREAGYLATMFKNVFLDIGEIFPQLSRDGQESALRQAFELSPASKLLYSTDGHLFPETYWLANKQFREGLEKVSIVDTYSTRTLNLYRSSSSTSPDKI